MDIEEILPEIVTVCTVLKMSYTDMKAHIINKKGKHFSVEVNSIHGLTI